MYSTRYFFIYVELGAVDPPSPSLNVQNNYDKRDATSKSVNGSAEVSILTSAW